MNKYNVKLESHDGRDWNITTSGKNPEEAGQKALNEAKQQQPQRIWRIIWTRSI